MTCPRCGRPTEGVCACGWATQPAPSLGTSTGPMKCATCAKILEARKDYRSWDTSWPMNHCYRCGTHDAGVKAFPDDTPCAEDRGVRMCSSCHVSALRRRATCDHAWDQGLRDGEKCERCEREITGHRELFREYMRIIEGRLV